MRAIFIGLLPLLAVACTSLPMPSPMPTSSPAHTTMPDATADALGLDFAGVRSNPIDGAIYVHIPAGEFIMGSYDGDDDERPEHTVYLDEFWIMQTEVTNGLYAKCVSAGACTVPENDRWDEAQFKAHPVTHVSWLSANDYAAWAGGRLPTEAEWEKACRGEDGRSYPWGNAAPDSTLLNFARDEGDTIEVGSYSAGASPYGALDMAGNVWEWTGDWYDGSDYTGSPERNPRGPDSGVATVLRGGSFRNSGPSVRCAMRAGSAPSDRFSIYGFRVASPAAIQPEHK